MNQPNDQQRAKKTNRGKPFLVYPTKKLRRRLETMAGGANRSLTKMTLLLVEEALQARDNSASAKPSA